MTTYTQRTEDARIKHKHDLEHLRRALLASRQEVAALRATPAPTPIIVADAAQLQRVEARLHAATQRATQATRTASRQRAALERIQQLVRGREVDWPALMLALHEGLER